MAKFIFNGNDLDIVTYPNGEIAIKNSEQDFKDWEVIISEKKFGNSTHNVLEWYDCNIGDLVVLQSIFNIVPINELYIDYFPYQRSDRDFFDNNYGFGLISKSINLIMDLFSKSIFSNVNSKIIINDPHTKLLTEEYIFRRYARSKDEIPVDKIDIIYNCVDKLSNNLDIDPGNTVIVYPDKSSFERYGELLEEFEKFIVIDKIRDEQTGKIISQEFNSNLSTFSFEDKDTYGSICVVDDICDYGGTFLGAKKVILDKYIDLEYYNWYLSMSHNTKCDKPQELLDNFKIL